MDIKYIVALRYKHTWFSNYHSFHLKTFVADVMFFLNLSIIIYYFTSCVIDIVKL